jgi:hypothetical protein
MLPSNPGGHSAYQKFVLDSFHEYYPDYDSLPLSSRTIIEHFWHLDLSMVDEQMKSKYSIFGPEPRLPSCMLRSMLVALEFKVISYTDWAAQLKINPLYAIISGFTPGDTPGVGTFYDFINRLWDSDLPNFSDNEHVPKAKVKKPSKKGAKANSIEKVTVEELLHSLEINPPTTSQPYETLFSIFKANFLDVSVEKKLINPDELALSGDGTPVVTSARERSHSICDCREKGISDCNCPRFYSQPDCDIGWDSSRCCFYSGYDLYMLTASDSESDLPVFPLLNCASMHDSHGFLRNWFSMKAFLPEYKISKVLLDSAHDAMPLYKYFKKNDIVPFIDLNEKRGIKLKYKDDFEIGKDGIPVCLQGLKMRHDGIEIKKNRSKFRCPLADRKNGCTCPNPCSDSKYGRTVHLQNKDNPRLINIPPRDSDEWKKEYNNRTSSERCNKREKIDYKYEDGSHRSSKHWYCRLYCIMMCQHLDAWDLPFESELRTKLKQAA